jgi:two-component system alkaline phosphatase synthesis response regulator PhoP
MAAPASRIVVVEDEIDVANLVKHALERGGDANVEIVASGAAALQSVSKTPPDLLILDLNLPGLDGTEICRILRARPASSLLPIIMLTARTDESDRVLGLDLGADDYITKPFSPRELAARVRAVLRRKSGATQAAMSLYRGAHLMPSRSPWTAPRCASRAGSSTCCAA